jgi:hypothetical protein
VTTGRSPSASAVTSTRTYSRRKRRRGLGSTGSSLPSDAADPSVAPHRRHARETRGVTVGEQRRSHRAADLVGRDLLGAGYLLADAVEALVGPVRVPGFSRSVTRIRLVTTEASPRRRFHLIVYGRSGRNCWCTRWCAQIRRSGAVAGLIPVARSGTPSGQRARRAGRRCWSAQAEGTDARSPVQGAPFTCVQRVLCGRGRSHGGGSSSLGAGRPPSPACRG